MKCIQIATNSRPVITDMKDDLKVFQNFVDGFIEIVPLYALDPTGQLLLICNEEGKLMDLPKNIYLFQSKGNPYDVVMGNAIIVRNGIDGESFEDITEKDIQAFIDLYDTIPLQ